MVLPRQLPDSSSQFLWCAGFLRNSLQEWLWNFFTECKASWIRRPISGCRTGWLKPVMMSGALCLSAVLPLRVMLTLYIHAAVISIFQRRT